MSDLMWSIPPNCSDRSLTAMEQILAAKNDSISTCMRIPLSDGVTSNPDDGWLMDDDEMRPLIKANVNPLAAKVFSGPPGSVGLSPRTKNVLLATEVREQEPWKEIVQKFDEIWASPGRPFQIMSSLTDPERVVKVIPASTIPSSVVTNGIPQGSPTMMLHEEWDDIRGVEAVIRAWLRDGDLKDGVLIISIRSSHIDQTSAFVTRIRMEEGVPRGMNRIFLMKNSSRKFLDSCLISSDVFICSHTNERGWRPLAIKAALLGKPVISSNRGDITSHIGDCFWIDTPDIKNVTNETMNIAMDDMIHNVTEGFSHSLSTDAKPALMLRSNGEKMPKFLHAAGERLLSIGS